MGRIMAIDYGNKRTGIAVTDELQLIASGLDTVLTADLYGFLKGYFEANEVETIVVGEPKDLRGGATDATKPIEEFCRALANKWPHIPVARIDERFTSKLAARSMVESGMKKKDRQKKGNLDRISATLMLQDYMQYR